MGAIITVYREENRCGKVKRFVQCDTAGIGVKSGVGGSASNCVQLLVIPNSRNNKNQKGSGELLSGKSREAFSLP